MNCRRRAPCCVDRSIDMVLKLVKNQYFTTLIIQINIINWIASNRRTFMRTLYKYLETKEAS